MARAVLTLVGDRAVASAALDLSREELLRFRALVEDSQDFIGMAELDGRIVYLNPGGRELVGLAPDVDIGTVRIPDLLSEAAYQHFVEEVRPNVRRLGAWQSESTLLDLRGGPPIPVASSTFLVRPVREGGQPVLATVQRDITRRVVDQQALQHLADARQDLLRRLVQAQEDERASIAQDVHDDSVQALAAVDLRLGLLRRQLEEREPDLLDSVDSTLVAVTEATRRLRTLLFDLESPAQAADLATALTEAATYVFDESGERWRITGDRTVDLPTPSRVTAYRVAKEALVNVRRHAGAQQVEIHLGRDGEDVVVTVLDDGAGIRAEDLVDQAGHLGLASMRDRTAIAGGRVEVSVRPEGGTRVRFWVPGGTTVPVTTSTE
nr:ATP-binding protein [Nocardioides luti]